MGQLSRKDIRLDPLGLDRHNRRYFAFPLDKSHSIYTEEEANGACTVVYNNRESLLRLVSWLSDRTPREAPLRHILNKFIDRYYPAEGAVGKLVIGGVKEQPEGGDVVRDYSSYVNKFGELERDNAADMYKYLVFPLNITDAERRMLGLVLADGDFKLNFYRNENGQKVEEPPTPRLGINISDRIMLANGVTITEPRWPQGTAPDPTKLTKTETGEVEEFQLLMWRGSKTIQSDIKGLAARVTASEWGYVQGWMLNLERDLINPLALGVDWANTKRAPWKEKVIRGVDGTGLKEAALELEAALKAKGTILVKEDREGRARGISSKWRQFVNLSRTPSQLLLALRCLNVSNAEELAAACTSMSGD